MSFPELDRLSGAQIGSDDLRRRVEGRRPAPVAVGGGTGRQDIPLTDDEELRYQIRGRLEEVAQRHSSLADVFMGTGVGASQGVGGLLSLTGSMPLDPMNLGVKIADYVFSRNPSDLVLPHHPADSPTGKRLRVAKEEFDKAFRRHDVARFAEFVGEFVPSVYMGAQSAGMVRGYTMSHAPKLMAEAGRSKLANRFSAKMAGALASLGDEMAESVARRASLEVVGGIPFAERTMMAFGNGLGWGTFEAVRTLGNTGDTEVAFKTGVAVAGFGSLAEVGLVGAGRLLKLGMPKKSIDTVKAWEEFEKLQPGLQDMVLAGDVKGIRAINGQLTVDELMRKNGSDFLTRAEKAISKLVDLEILENAQGFGKALSKMTPREAKEVLQRVNELYREADLTGKMKEMAGAAREKAWAELPRAQRAMVETPSGKRGLLRKARKYVGEVHEAEQELRAAATSMDALDIAAQAPNLRRMLDSTPVSPAQRLAELGDLGEAWAKTAAEEIEAGGRRSLGTAYRQVDTALRRGAWSVYSDLLHGFQVRSLASPSGLAKKLQIPGLQLLEMMEAVEAEIKAQRMKVWATLNRFSQEVAVIGQGNKAFPHHVDGTVVTEGGAHVAAIVDVFENAGEVGAGLEAVQAKFGPEIRRLWQQKIVNSLAYYGEELQGTGVNSMMGAGELAANGVSDYFPQVVKSGTNWARTERQIREALSRKGYRGAEIEAILGEGGWKRGGLRQFGTIDQQRKMVGSTRDKIGYGIPLEENPLETLRQHFDASIVRLALAKRFGPNGELGSYWKAAIVNAGGSETEANVLVDTFLFESAPNRAAAKWAKRFTSAQIVTKLSWAVIPNAFQTTITAIRFGPKATVVGTGEAMRDAASNWRIARALRETIASTDKEIVATSLGFMEKSIQTGESVFLGAPPKTLAERVASGYLKAIGFSMTERWNRTIAAHAGLAHARWNLEKMAKGQLRGSSYVNAVRSLDSLGIDPVKIVDRFRGTGVLKLTPAELEQVMTNSVKQTQFSTGLLDIPPAWRTPWGRVITQFKSFAFSAGKTFRDQVWREFDQGNYKPFLYYMALGGVSGDLIGAILSAAKGRERQFPDGPGRMVEDLANFGGFGLAQTFVEASLYGRTLGSLIGPTLDMGLKDIPENLVRFGPVEGTYRLGKKQPTVQTIGRAFEGAVELGGALLDGPANALEEGWELLRREDLGETARPAGGSGIDELRRRMEKEK